MDGTGNKKPLQPADTVEEFGAPSLGNGNSDPIFKDDHSFFAVLADKGQVDQVRLVHLEKSVRF